MSKAAESTHSDQLIRKQVWDIAVKGFDPSARVIIAQESEGGNWREPTLIVQAEGNFPSATHIDIHLFPTFRRSMEVAFRVFSNWAQDVGKKAEPQE